MMALVPHAAPLPPFKLKMPLILKQPYSPRWVILMYNIVYDLQHLLLILLSILRCVCFVIGRYLFGVRCLTTRAGRAAFIIKFSTNPNSRRLHPQLGLYNTLFRWSIRVRVRILSVYECSHLDFFV